MFLIYTFIFALGAIIGSFLNVVILRSGARFLSERSKCFSCGKTLGFLELVPIFSFIWLGGRCSACKSRISLQYPLVEFLTGLLFLLIYFKNPVQNPFSAAAAALFFDLAAAAFFMVIFFYDARHKMIPDGPAYFLIILSLLKTIFFQPSVLNFLSGPVFFLFFFAIWFFSKGRAMGFGDAKLALAIGWFLPFAEAASGIILSIWTGAALGLSAIFFGKIGGLNFGGKKITIKSEIPFGPFLVLGAVLVYFFQIDLLGLSLFFN